MRYQCVQSLHVLIPGWRLVEKEAGNIIFHAKVVQLSFSISVDFGMRDIDNPRFLKPDLLLFNFRLTQRFRGYWKLSRGGLHFDLLDISRKQPADSTKQGRMAEYQALVSRRICCVSSFERFRIIS